MNNPQSKNPTESLFFPALILLTVRLTTNLPLLHIRISGSGAPLWTLTSGLAALAVTFLLCRKLTGANLLTATEKAFGKLGKLILSLILLVYLFISTSYTLTETVSFTKLIALPSTPFWFAAIIFILAAIFGAIGNTEGLLRTSPFIALFFLAILAVTAVSVLSRGTFTNLFPILGTDAKGALSKNFAGISAYADIITVFLLIPDENPSKKLRRSLLTATGLAVIINFIFILAYTSAIPYPLSAKEQFPAYLLLKQVYLGRFFHRIDALFLLSSTMSGMFSIALNLMLMGRIFQHTFGIYPSRISIFPLAGLVYFLALTSPHFPVTLPISASLILVAIFTTAAIFTRKEKPLKNEK